MEKNRMGQKSLAQNSAENYENLIKALQALSPAQSMNVSYLLKQDTSVPELILSLKIQPFLEEVAAND